MTATDTDSAFTGFVEEYQGALRRTAYFLTGNPQTAEDLLQDTLVKAWLAWRRIGPGGELAYTRRIMVNLATDRWRRRRYETTPVEPPDASPDPHAGDPFAAADDRDFIVRQLATLSAKERAIVVLRYYADLSEADVADAAGVSVGTVKSTCSRALARLRSRGEAAQATRSRS